MDMPSMDAVFSDEGFDPISQVKAAVYAGYALRHGGFSGAVASKSETAEAGLFFERAASLGDQWSVFEMGTCFHLGDCASRDLSKARQWYTRAIEEHGDLQAHHMLRLLENEVRSQSDLDQ